MANALSIGQLREAIIEACDLGGSWGQNMHESKDVVLRVGERTYPLIRVASSFLEGRFYMGIVTKIHVALGIVETALEMAGGLDGR